MKEDIKGMCYVTSSTNQEIEDSVLPEYFPYLSLMFSLIATTVILLLSGWVVYTIRTKTSLYKPNSIFAANLLVSDMIVAVLIFIIQCSMMINYQFGVKLFLSCYAYKFAVLSLLLVINFSIAILVLDTLIAMLFPSMYQRMKTSYVAAAIVSAKWLLAVILAIVYMVVFDCDDVLGVPGYGACVFERKTYIETVNKSLTKFVVSFFAIFFHVLLISTALQIRRWELLKSNSSGVNATMKSGLLSINYEGKLPITLFLISFVIHLYLQLHLLSRSFNILHAHHQAIIEYVSNTIYALYFIHALIFIWYCFKQVHKLINQYFVVKENVKSVTPCVAVV